MIARRRLPGRPGTAGRPSRVGVVAALTALALVACAPGSPAPSSIPQPVRATGAASPSTTSPAGAMAGFLAAAGTGGAGVSQWLATPTDVADLADLVSVYGGFGNGESLFWEITGLRVTAVTTVDATHADVMLSGPVVWCGGAARTDPAATCSVVNSVSGLRDTYVAARAGGGWKADIDVDASSALTGNPAAPRTPAAATPSST